MPQRRARGSQRLARRELKLVVEKRAAVPSLNRPNRPSKVDKRAESLIASRVSGLGSCASVDGAHLCPRGRPVGLLHPTRRRSKVSRRGEARRRISSVHFCRGLKGPKECRTGCHSPIAAGEMQSTHSLRCHQLSAQGPIPSLVRFTQKNPSPLINLLLSHFPTSSNPFHH